MHILVQYLFLKLKLFYRSLGKHKALISVVTGIIFIFLIVKFYMANEVEYNHIVIGISVGLMTVIQYHLKRKDKDFLINQIGKNKVYFLLLFEYAILIVPLVILLLAKGYQETFVLLFAPFVIPFLPNNFLHSSFHISPFGKGNFEWNSGLRLFSIFQWILLLAFTVSCAFQLNYFMSMVFMAIILISFGFYYGINEDEQMIIPYRSAKELMSSKRYFLIKNMVLCGVVLSIVLSLFYGQFDWVILLILAQSIVLAFTSLVVKYTFYPNKNAGDLQLSILFIFGLIPFLSPLLLILCFHYYKRAIKRLNPYFNT